MKKNGVNRKPSGSQKGKFDLKPVIAAINKLATRMERLDKKMDSFRQETARKFEKSSKETASLRKEMALEFNKSREETAALRQDMVREFQKSDSFRKETTEQFKISHKGMKQQIKSVRDEVAKYYFMAHDESRIIADEHARTLTKTYTTMDRMAKDYSRWLIEKQYNDVELERHSREIKELTEKDSEKDMRLHNLQSRVAALENTKNGGAAIFQSEPQLTE